jgi:DNA-binding MarR family transcriptional regulator
MLERIRGIHHPCDLDLLLFFHRHRRTLLTSEWLATFVGYDRERVAKSLDGLIEAGHLKRSQSLSRGARLYLLELSGADGGSLASLLSIAATRQGRRDVMRFLVSGPNGVRHGASVTKIA